MRKLIPILITLVVLLGAFFIYFRSQTKFSAVGDNQNSPDRFAAPGGNTFIKAGTGAWAKQFDHDGRLYYQFRSDFYDPQPDGTVKVTRPVIQFFLSGSQILQIKGVDGIIRFAPGADQGVMSNAPSDPPRYGTLRHVTVKLFDSAAQEKSDSPSMTMTMTNAQFDNDTYRLFTQEYVDAAGKVIHGDDVPVNIRAKDYSFDGSGLVMYWNDMDRQLKSLEIAHGKDLTVYNTEDFSVTPASSAPAPPSSNAPAPSAASAAAPESQPESQNPPHRYRATFFDRVRVMQAGEPLVRAQQMDVDFISRSGNSAQSSSGDLSGEAKSETATTTKSATPTTQPASPPATAPSPQPVHIYWAGKMRMVPIPETAGEPLPPGKAIVHFSGSPVLLRQTEANGQRIDGKCADLLYRTADSSAKLSGDVLLSQTRTDGLVSTVAGPSVEFSKLTHIATVDGAGWAKLPDPNDPQKGVLDARWQRSCRVHLYDLDKDQTQIEQADLTGNVVINHPRFHLTARDDVRLRFDRLTVAEARRNSSPPLRQVTAIGNADCVIHEAGQGDRRISGDQLQLFRDPGPDGELYAKTIVCDGSVRAQQEDQTLTAEHLQIGLRPAPAKSKNQAEDEASLDTLIATTKVHVTGKDSSAASADKLYVRMLDDHAHVTLLGSPSGEAMVKNKGATITGPVIHISPHDQTASIEGPGTFDGLQQPKDPTQKPRPLKLTWQQRAWFNGNTNQVVAVGDARANSSSPDQGHNWAKCDRIVATLIDAPPATTRPSTRPAEPDSYGTDSDFLKNKQVKTVSLLAANTGPHATTRPDAQAESFLTDASGYLLHQYDLLSQRIDYEVADKRVVVPGPGRIFAQEQPPPTTRPAAEDQSNIGGHGMTSIQWQKRFVYDELRHASVIEGSVTIVHWTPGPRSRQSIRLDHADIVQAEFEASGKPTTRSAASDVDQMQSQQLKLLTAIGAMTVLTPDKTIYCGQITLDPATQTLTCLGGQMGNVTVVDNQNLNTNVCSEAVFDIKTNELKMMRNAEGQGR